MAAPSAAVTSSQVFDDFEKFKTHKVDGFKEVGYFLYFQNHTHLINVWKGDGEVPVTSGWFECFQEMNKLVGGNFGSSSSKTSYEKIISVYASTIAPNQKRVFTYTRSCEGNQYDAVRIPEWKETETNSLFWKEPIATLISQHPHK